MDDKCIRFPESDCLGLHKAAELEKDLDELKAGLEKDMDGIRADMGELRRQNASTHERLFDRLNDLESQEGVQKEQYKHIMEKLTQLAADMAEIKARPAKRWEGIVEQVIGIVVAAVVGFMLARIGI